MTQSTQTSGLPEDRIQLDDLKHLRSEFMQILRFVSLPLLHAIWTGTAAYIVGLSLATPKFRRPFTFFAVAFTAVLHGIYDTFSGTIPGLIVAIASLLLFVSYIRTPVPQSDPVEAA